jgi:hypothetical protein
MAADRVTCCWKLVGKSCRKLVTGVPSRSHDCLRPHRCRRPGSVKGVACSTRPNGADHHRGRLGRLLPQPYRPLTAAAAAVPQIPGGDHGFHGGSASGGSVGLGSYHNPISKRCQTNFTHQGRPGRAGGCRPGRPPPGPGAGTPPPPLVRRLSHGCLRILSRFSQRRPGRRADPGFRPGRPLPEPYRPTGRHQGRPGLSAWPPPAPESVKVVVAANVATWPPPSWWSASTWPKNKRTFPQRGGSQKGPRRASEKPLSCPAASPNWPPPPPAPATLPRRCY